MFLYGLTPPKITTFAPSYDDTEAAYTQLWDAARDLQLYRDNSNAHENAIAEAYDRRNRSIFEATGVQLENPYRASEETLKESVRERMFNGTFGFKKWRDGLETEWQDKVRDLARERPEFAGVIAADRPISEDAFAIARGAEAGMAKATADAEAAGIPGAGRLGPTLGGSFAGMLRDPLQVGTLFLGGGISTPARAVGWRMAEVMLSEAAINAGVETGIQAASYEWKKQAGVEHGLGASLQQIGLAALFGGGFGGLLQGGREVFRLLGKAAPEEVLARVAAGDAQPGDMQRIGDALGLDLDPQSTRVAEIAAEQPALDRAAFGEPPAGMTAHETETLAAQAVRAAEEGTIGLRSEAIDRIVQREMPLGPEPKKPVTLIQFLASRSVGGIMDEGGALTSMGLSRHFVPGSGPLVRKNGKSLDYAREAAAEAGYLDHLYGDPERAMAQSTPDDLLRLIEQERGGDPVLSPRNDGGRQFAWLEHQQRRRAQQAYRQIIEEVDSALDTLGIEHQLDDAVLTRAAELVDDETDAVTALERALDEDYRAYADALGERGEAAYDDADIPFFENTGPVPRAGGADGEARLDGQPGGRGADEAHGDELSRAGGDEGQALERQPLRAAGDTPETGTAQAGEIADMDLTEARHTEKTAAGDQMLIDGVQPVSTRDKLEAEAAKPMRGGDKPLPPGGLFDETARQQIDMWDAMPAAREADGTVRHVTHRELVENAERDAFFGDLIASCKD